MEQIELHVHPFLGRNTINDVAQAMDNQGLDILAMESLDDSLFPFVVEQSKIAYSTAVVDQSGVRLPNGKYFLNALVHSRNSDVARNHQKSCAGSL